MNCRQGIKFKATPHKFCGMNIGFAGRARHRVIWVIFVYTYKNK